MKSKIKNNCFFLVFLLSCLLMNTSCEYDKIADVEFPGSLIYLPIATNGNISTNGVYTINTGASTAWISPTPGQPLKYSVVQGENKFIIPLGVYRSGVGSTISHSATAKISLNTDTVAKLIGNGGLSGVEVLPSGKMQFPTSVNISKKENEGAFEIVVDLDFLRLDAPKKYAIGITISESTEKINRELSTGIVVIDTRIMIPVANFEAQLVGSSTDTFSFNNTSLYWDFFSGEKAFTWNFGDGNTTSNETNPQHKYSTLGDYLVTLTVKGVIGESVIISKSISVK